MDNVSGLPNRGKTWFDGTTPPTTFATSVDLEGVLKQFDDTDPATGTGSAQIRRSGRQNACRLVRNVAAIALEPKRVVRWKAGFRGLRVDGYTAVDHQEAAGVVDDHYGSTGIPVNDLGWLVVAGPCLVKTSLGADATNVIVEGDVLSALTGATSGATTSGRIQPFVLTSNGTVGNQVNANKIGHAMSAKTTGNTNADVLVDVEILSSVS